MDAQHQAQRDLIEDTTDQLVASLAGFPELPPLPPVSLPRTARVNWNLFEANEDTILPLSWEQEVVQEAVRALHVRFQQVDTVGSEDEDEEWADEDIEEVPPVVEPRISGMFNMSFHLHILTTRSGQWRVWTYVFSREACSRRTE